MAFDDPEDVPGVEPPAETAPAVKREGPSTPSPSLDSLVTLPPGLTEALTDNKRAEIAQKGAVNKLFTQRAEEDRSRALDAYKATAIQPGELQPWDAEAARQKYKTDPLESFGSLGSVFAMIASAFTHAPMTNALNAGAAAMNAIKDGKDQDYERAFKAFKENTDLALKRHGIMQQRYSDADKFRSSDLTQWRSEMQAVATQFDDQHMLTFLQAGFDKELLDAQHSRIKVAQDLQALSETDFDHQMKRSAFKQLSDSIDQEFADPAERVGRKLAAMRMIFDKKEPKAEDAAWASWMMTQGYKASPDEMLAKAAELRKRYGHNTVDEIQAETAKALEQKYLAEGMDPAEAKRRGLEESTRAASKNAAGRGAGAKGEAGARAEATITQMEDELGTPLTTTEKNMYHQAFEASGVNSSLHLSKFAAAMEKLKEMNRALPAGEKLSDAQRMAVMDRFAQATPTASPESIDVGAELYIKGSPSWSKGVGRDAHSIANVQAIKERATQLLMDPEGDYKLSARDAAKLVAQNAQIYAGNNKAAQILFSRVAGIMSPSIEALSVSGRVLEWSDKINRSRFPTLNKFLLASEQELGSTEQINYRIAVDALLNQYARAIAGGQGVSTVDAQKRARTQMEIAYNKGQIRAAVDQIRTEMFDLLKGTQATVQFWKDGTLPEGVGPLPGSAFKPIPDLPGYTVRTR